MRIYYILVLLINFSKTFSCDNIKQSISGYAFDDNATRKGLAEVYQQYQYVIDPHGAVGYLALKNYQQRHPNTKGIILETAHPSKFINDVENILNIKVNIPERLASLANKEKVATKISTSYNPFKDWLLNTYN